MLEATISFDYLRIKCIWHVSSPFFLQDKEKIGERKKKAAPSPIHLIYTLMPFAMFYRAVCGGFDLSCVVS